MTQAWYKVKPLYFKLEHSPWVMIIRKKIVKEIISIAVFGEVGV